MKNIVVIPMMIPKDKDLHKFGGWSWMEYSKKAWEYWCKKNNCELIIYDKPSIEDTSIVSLNLFSSEQLIKSTALIFESNHWSYSM